MDQNDKPSELTNMATTSQFGRRGLSQPPADSMARCVNIPPKRGPDVDSNDFTMMTYLFSFEGRISRSQFWLGRIAVIAITIVLSLTVHSLHGDVDALKQLQPPCRVGDRWPWIAGAAGLVAYDVLG
jgi:hypothetical protein